MYYKNFILAFYTNLYSFKTKSKHAKIQDFALHH